MAYDEDVLELEQECRASMMEIENLRSDIERKDAEIAKLRAVLIACVDHWRDPEIPCPPALHDQVTDALLSSEQKVAED